MPEISEKLISLFSHAILSGIAVIAAVVVWHALARRYPKYPKPAAGLLIAGAFIVSEVVNPPSSFMTNPGLLLFVVLCALWMAWSIAYWRNLTYLFLPLSLAGIFLTVPDTEEVVLLLGIAIPTAVFAWPMHRFTYISKLDAASLGAIIPWVICLGGQGRPASIVVSFACLGLLAISPLLFLFRKPRNFAMKQFWFMAILFHILSITIALGIARTTQRMELAAVALLAALSLPTIFLTVTWKKYYINEGTTQINDAKFK